jgi:hypothetical protein
MIERFYKMHIFISSLLGAKKAIFSLISGVQGSLHLFRTKVCRNSAAEMIYIAKPMIYITRDIYRAFWPSLVKNDKSFTARADGVLRASE